MSENNSKFNIKYVNAYTCEVYYRFAEFFYHETALFVSDLQQGQNYGPDLFLQTNDFLPLFKSFEITLTLTDNFGTCPFMLT